MLLDRLLELTLVLQLLVLLLVVLLVVLLMVLLMVLLLVLLGLVLALVSRERHRLAVVELTSSHLVVDETFRELWVLDGDGRRGCCNGGRGTMIKLTHVFLCRARYCQH